MKLQGSKDILDAVKALETTARLIDECPKTPEGMMRKLSLLGSFRGQLSAIRVLTIQQARSEGYSWGEIGTALGTSRQAAWSRYKDLVS